jgi:hypothetical protein
MGNSISVSNVAITTVSVTTAGTGYTMQPISIGPSNYRPFNIMQISGDDGSLLTISKDGEVTWTGSANKASRSFVNMVSHQLDVIATGEMALARSYRRAIERCLRQAKSMDHDEFIAVLENEVQTRLSKSVLMSLRENEE